MWTLEYFIASLSKIVAEKAACRMNSPNENAADTAAF
jgi:hypothetical protein